MLLFTELPRYLLMPVGSVAMSLTSFLILAICSLFVFVSLPFQFLIFSENSFWFMDVFA
jgi:hypothetical protein